MAEIIDIQAPPEKVVNAMNQMTAAAQRFDGAVGGLGKREFHDPFLKGERAVSRASANMVTGLLNATSVSDALSNSLLQVEKGGRLGLGLAVGVAVGVAAFEALSKAIQHSHEVHDAAEKALSRPLGVQTGLDAAGIGREISATAAALAAEHTQNTGFSEAFLGTFSDPRAYLKDRFGLFDSHKTRGDENFDRELAVNEKLNALAHAQGEEALRVAQFKKDALDADEHTVAYAKAELEFKNKVSELKLKSLDNPALSAGYSDSFKALKMELDVAKQIADKKQEKADSGDLIQEEENRAASEIANFQGTKGEKEDFSAARSKDRLQNEIDILHAFHDQEGEQKKQLELDDLISKNSEKKAEEAKKKADEDFKSDSELKGAKVANQVTALQQSGQSFQANLLKIRETTEQKIATLLHDQKNALAQQEVIAGKLALRDAAKKEFFKTPEERAAAGKAAAQEAEFAQYLKYYQDQLARGVRFDKSDEKANIAAQLLDEQKKLDLAGGKDKSKDFSSVNSLAGQDFSSLAGLAKLDFSGLAKLGALKVL